MNAELKAKWIEALRSGKYKQGRGGLRTDDRFCCLGVLAELCGVTWEKEGAFFGVAEKEGAGGYYGADVGLTHQQEQELAWQNDKADSSFESVADYIEREIPAETSNEEPR